MDRQTSKFFKEQHQTKGCGDWFASSSRRQAKLRASKIDLEQKYEIVTPIKDTIKPFDISKCRVN
jgi:hypothetical protein